MKKFKIEIVIKGNTLKTWVKVLGSLLSFLDSLGVEVSGGIVYELKEKRNGKG